MTAPATQPATSNPIRNCCHFDFCSASCSFSISASVEVGGSESGLFAWQQQVSHFCPPAWLIKQTTRPSRTLATGSAISFGIWNSGRWEVRAKSDFFEADQRLSNLATIILHTEPGLAMFLCTNFKVAID